MTLTIDHRMLHKLFATMVHRAYGEQCPGRNWRHASREDRKRCKAKAREQMDAFLQLRLRPFTEEDIDALRKLQRLCTHPQAALRRGIQATTCYLCGALVSIRISIEVKL